MRRLRLAIAALLVLAAPAAAQDAADRSFEAGRVGAIVKGKTTPEELAKLYGADKVQYATIHAPGGGQQDPGAFIHAETPDALELVFSEDSKRIESVTILGKNWAGKDGLKVGANLAALERLNGGPFKFYGFGFDYGGQVIATGPALKGLIVFVRFVDNAGGKATDHFAGEKEFSSRDPALKGHDLEVVMIMLNFGAD
jgi:hypothetical protein